MGQFIGGDWRIREWKEKLIEIHSLAIQRALDRMLEDGTLEKYIVKALEQHTE